LSKESNLLASPVQKGKPLRNKRNPLPVTNVVRRVTNPSSAEQKINELFSGEPELQKKLHSLLIQNKSDEEDYYYSESSEDSEYESSPIPTLNVLTNKSQKNSFLIS